MSSDLLNPADPPARQIEKLLAIAEVLMRRVEQGTDDGGAAYAQFQRAAMLEDQVRDRTRDLERALDLLNASNAALGLANRETEAARRNLADAIETVQEGFALFDARDILVMCNSRFGRDMGDVHPHLVPGLTFEAYIERVSRSVDLALPVGETPESWAVQRRRRHQDRHVMFNVAMTGGRWMQVSEHRTAEGGTVILQTDVTGIIRRERHERGRMLDDQARIMRATLDHLDQGVCIFDAEAALVGWNGRLADVLGLPASRMVPGQHFAAMLGQLKDLLEFRAGFDPAALENWVGRLQARPPLRFEVQRGAVMLSVFAQEMPDGGFVMSFTDVTAERSALAALSRANETLEARVTARTLELQDALEGAERANASRSRFVAATSHDLLQPLSAAKLFMGLVLDSPLPARATEAVAKAQAALGSVEALLAALLDISRLESGRLAVNIAPVRLDGLLRQLADEFGAIAATKGLELRVLPCNAVVASDPTYLRRILQNLIGNAIRYTDRGRILVGVRKRGAMLRVEVWDTGPGIPEGEHDNIFKEFHRLHAPASSSDGMGLGLAIVERACGLLGHPLDLVSVMGKGTVFRLHLPRSEPEGAAGRIERDTAQLLLVVEKDTRTRAAIVQVLEGWGVSVLEAGSGSEVEVLLNDLGILPDAVVARPEFDLALISGLPRLEMPDGQVDLKALRAFVRPGTTTIAQ